MRVLVTGAESSGTGVVATILRQAGAEVDHYAMPHVHDWHKAVRAATKADRIVVVIRGFAAHCRSLEERSGELGRNREQWTTAEYRRKCIDQLAGMFMDERTVVVTLESLTFPEEVEALCAELGLDFSKVETRVTLAPNLRRYHPDVEFA